MTVVGTTTPGMEDAATREGLRLFAAAGVEATSGSGAPADSLGGPGRVLPAGMVSWTVRAEREPGEWLDAGPLRNSRTLYQAYEDAQVLSWDGRSLESLVEAVSACRFDWLSRVTSFRVSCERSGVHPFKSPEVERAVGTLLHERYRIGARMEGYQLHIGLEIRERFAVIGYRLTRRKGYDRRYDWRFHPRITLRTPVAYFMLEESGFVAEPGSLYDPCCGSGTILLEAASVAREQGRAVEIRGSDREAASVSGARLNSSANKLEFTVEQIDANTLRPKLHSASVDYIVTNPPYGARLGRGIDYHLLYQSILSVASHALRDGGRLALLVERKRGAFEDVRANFGKLVDRDVRDLTLGGLHPRLIVLEREPRQS